MSRGLGTGQRLMLQALAALEAEHGSGDGLFYVWAIVDRAYALSPEMQARHRAQTDAGEAQWAALRERAKTGDALAAQYISLTRAASQMRVAPRKRRESPFRVSEGGFNPSRILASLERRGLVSRRAVNGGGSAGLTDAGRAEAIPLSVGTTLPVQGVDHAEAR